MRLQISLAIFVAGLAVTCLPLYGQDPGPDEVIGVTGVVTPYSSQVQGYGFTEMGANVAYYYDAYVEVYLSQNNSPLESGASPVDNPVAGGYLPPVGTAPDSKYEIVSNHYLVAYFAYYDPSTGYPVYGNPEGFLSNGGDFGNSTSFDPGGPATYITSELLYLGSTGGEIDTTPPNITGLYISGTNTPAALSLNTSGSLDIRGDHLTALGLDLEPEIGVSDSGITLQLTNPSDAQLTVSYTVAGSTQPGQQWLNVTTNAGVSNSVNFNVGDATPSITSISPNVWNAGATTQFTISGTGFGTNPALTVTGNGITSSTIIGIPTDTQITASVTVSISAPSGSATVSVQSNGYGGSGFQPAQNGQSNQGNANTTVQPVAAPVPQISFLGSNIAGAPQPTAVLLGQQIALTGSATLPTGLFITSQQWTLPTGTAIGGYAASTGGPGCVTPLLPLSGAGYCGTPPSFFNSAYTFYWVDIGNSRQMTYSITLNNGQSNSATATFNVTGPTAPYIIATEGTMQIQPILNNQINPQGVPTLLLNGVPQGTGQVGIRFLGIATLPQATPGIFSWVQLVNSDIVQLVKSTGPASCAIWPAGNPGLDNSYPYGLAGLSLFSTNVPNDTATDGPRIGLSSTKGETQRAFKATMYLMWNSGLAGSIPVPLASMNWKMAGDAINTLSPNQGANGTNWMLGCGNRSNDACHISVPSADLNQSYPTWTLTDTNGSPACLQ